MSSINANVLFPVTATVVNTGSEGLSFAGNFLDTNPIIPNNLTQSTLQFNTIQAVEDFFGIESTEADIASNYFNSYNNSPIKPKFILFTRAIYEEVDAYIQGNEVTAALSSFTAITSGSIIFNISGVAKTVSSINLGTATSYSQVASIIQVAARLVAGLEACTVTYSSATNAFKFVTGYSTGADTITWCTNGTLAALMGFQTTAATEMVILPGVGYLSQGSIELTDAANLARLTRLTTNFASFTNTFDVDADTDYEFYLAASEWANDNGYMFCQYNNVSSANELLFNDELVDGDFASVAPNYGSLNIAAFVMGSGASIDYNRTNGIISFSFKGQTGLEPSVTDDVTAAALVTAKVNFYGRYSNQSNSYNFYQQGRITGQFIFIQNFYNQMWLANGIQNSLLNLFANATIVGYSIQGYTLMQNTLDGVMQQALNNGVCTKGNTFSAAQIALLTQQAGYDISSFLTNYGYYIQIQPVGGDERASNDPPPTTIWYTNGGVILTLPVTTTYVV